jgi:hypothetical protein
MPVSDIEAWIADNSGNDAGNFPWSALAEVARQHATYPPPKSVSEALAWGRVAEKASEFVKTKLLGTRDSFDRSMMRVRALLIKRFGCSADEDLLSPQRLIDWYNTQTPGSPAEIATMARNWKSLPAEQILLLRHIKEGITILQLTSSDDNAERDPAISALIEKWLPVKSLLP